jgi:hypothetical protein
MTKDEALDLALETLESIQAVYPCETVGKRITAIKQARSAPVQEQGQSCYCPNCEELSKKFAALKEHLTEAKKVELANNWFAEDWAITKAVGMLHDYDRILRSVTPPAAQRQWTGLTDEEVSQLIGGMPHGKMVRAIEAKLKEKNT